MYLLLLFLSVWFAQCIDSQQPVTSDFQFNATIGAFSDEVITECNGDYENCDYLKNAFCEGSLFTVPAKMAPTYDTNCTANALSPYEMGSMKWMVHVQYITTFATDLTIDLSCPTFGGLFRTALTNLMVQAEAPAFSFKIDGIKPHPKPFDPAKLSDTRFTVKGQLCDGNFQPVDKSVWVKLADNVLLQKLKNETVFNTQMGGLLFTAKEVTLSNLEKNEQGNHLYVTFVLTLTKTYAQKLKINPLCDAAVILQLSLNDTQGSTYTLCDAKVSALASVTRIPVKTLVFVSVLSYSVSII